jgi:membrane-associated protease RseP (regulator of RpoE activity)
MARPTDIGCGARRFAVTQTEFGIKPIPVGGVVAVKDKLDIAFSITAQR